MALTDFFKQIADSIRSKDGTTDVIPAIDFPQRILDIPSSGGNESSFEITTGEFILSEDHNLYDSANGVENNFVVNHAIGKVPSIFFLYLDTEGITGTIPLSTISFAILTTPVRLTTLTDANYQRISRINSTTNSTATDNSITASRELVVADEDNVTIGKGIIADNYIFRSGYTYKWIAFVVKEGVE